MSRRNQRALPPKKDENDDDAIEGEIVNPNPQINSRILEKFAEKDREHEDLERFLGTVTKFNKENLATNREHSELHPDAIDHRKTKAFRRHCYGALFVFASGLVIAMPFVNLVVAGTFGIIVMLVICGVMLNARDREMDLSGFLQMIKTIAQRDKK